LINGDIIQTERAADAPGKETWRTSSEKSAKRTATKEKEKNARIGIDREKRQAFLDSSNAGETEQGSK